MADTFDHPDFQQGQLAGLKAGTLSPWVSQTLHASESS